jgi:hypothetical protein
MVAYGLHSAYSCLKIDMTHPLEAKHINEANYHHLQENVQVAKITT